MAGVSQKISLFSYRWVSGLLVIGLFARLLVICDLTNAAPCDNVTKAIPFNDPVLQIDGSSIPIEKSDDGSSEYHSASSSSEFPIGTKFRFHATAWDIDICDYICSQVEYKDEMVGRSVRIKWQIHVDPSSPSSCTFTETLYTDSTTESFLDWKPPSNLFDKYVTGSGTRVVLKVTATPTDEGAQSLPCDYRTETGTPVSFTLTLDDADSLSITPKSVLVAVGVSKEFSVSGKKYREVTLTATDGSIEGSNPIALNSEGEATFDVTWSTASSSEEDRSVIAVYDPPGTTPPAAAVVTVVGVAKVVKAGTVNEGPIELKLGLSVDLEAIRVPATGTTWPSGWPKWEVADQPGPFVGSRLSKTGTNEVSFIPDAVGTWKIKATCGTSNDVIEIDVDSGCSMVESITSISSSCYIRVYNELNIDPASTPINFIGVRGNPGETITLTISPESGANPGLFSWIGANQDSSNSLKATVAIDQSVRRRVVVRYNGEDCREVIVWPIYAELEIRLNGNLSIENDAQKILKLDSARFWQSQHGGGSSLGRINKWDEPGFTYLDAGTRMEARATLSPGGVGDVIPIGAVKIFRGVTRKVFINGEDTGIDEESDPGDPGYTDFNPRGNDLLFMLDIPGVKQDTEFLFDQIELYQNFLQYVSLTICDHEVVCSKTKKWGTHVKVDYTSPTPVVVNDAIHDWFTISD